MTCLDTENIYFLLWWVHIKDMWNDILSVQKDRGTNRDAVTIGSTPEI
jgi:hypothetical protein